MRILITGANGMLGRTLQKKLADYTLIPTDLPDGDITDESAFDALVAREKPDVVIHCAAMTAVDDCESKQDLAYKLNALGSANVAGACARHGARLIAISTDYVFDGDGARASDGTVIPYTEWDACRPRSIYGKSKWLGEQYVREMCARSFVVRTAWLYGYVGGNFVKTMWRNGAKNGALTVVDDQRGNPTSATDLAYHLLKLACTEEYGIYHCTNQGVCSWYDFAVEIIRLAGINCTVTPCTTEEFQRIASRPARRPAYSALDNAMLRCTVGDEMREWKAALAEYIERLKATGGPQ